MLTLNRPEHLTALSNGLRDDLFAARCGPNPGDDVLAIRLRDAGRAFCPRDGPQPSGRHRERWSRDPTGRAGMTVPE